MDAPRRKRWLVGGLVAAGVVLLILLPGWLASRPGFFGRYPGLQEQYKPWSTSSHVEVSCADCHVPPGVVTQAVYRTRMVGEFYLSLVARGRVPNVFPTPQNAACLKCHNDLRTVSPKGDLQIPHRAHVTILKMRCVECHNYLVHEKSPEGKHTPRMATCMKCHNGDTAKNTCTACHTEKAAPATHKAPDWLVVHGEKGSQPECNSCHRWTDKWCADCHKRRPASHTADWRAVHGDAVKKHRGCEACHDDAYCIRCHGEVPKENFNPDLKPVK